MHELAQRLQEALSGRYRIERELGQGGMATVFLARDCKHVHRAVALKVLRPELAGVLGAERFVSEIGFAALLNHPHIVPMFDSGEADGLLYYVMPVVEGETLRERLLRGPSPAADEIVRIGCGVASALSCAHQHGIVHRDVKPANIILSGGEAIVTDFGIALALRAAVGGATPSGLLLGTPGYVSPEQATGSPDVDGRADLYSLGAVLYTMAVGDAPRCWQTAEDVRLGRITMAPPEARVRLDALPRGLEAALAKALAAFPGDRYGSAAELADALRASEVPERPADRWSVAILPLTDLTGDPGTQFLGDGLSEEITYALARVRSLRVTSRTSAFAYQERHLDIRQIGRELGVSAVLEGSVRSSGGALRVTVQLIDVATGYPLWSERYERPMRDAFAIQDEIARSVVQALRVILTDSERRALTRVPTPNPEAYEYYLRGRQFFHQARKKSLEYALQMFARSIEIDPAFALAHAGVADCCSLLHMYYPTSAGSLAQADAASQRALELDPDSPESHAARGFALSQLGRGDEAAAEFQTAIRLDPTLAEPRYFYARQCFEQGKLAEAARWFEDAARVEDNFEARFFAAQAYEADGRRDEALAAYRRALAAAERQLAFHPDDPRAATMRAVSLCRLGEPAEGLAWARRALEMDPSDAGVRYNVACLYALEEKREEALACLEECVRLEFGNLAWIARDPDLASLRGDARFEALVGQAAQGA
jgi:TolB-like protein/Flp pilus assembly protein TadD/tRNA A-37 threonylcarbamoyl transferase component Bud32